MPGSRQPRILFLTFPEWGQANVHLAVLHSLARSHPDASLHLGSFAMLKPRTPRSVTFHTVFGYGITDMFRSLYPEAVQNPKILQRHYTVPGPIDAVLGCIRSSVWAFHPEKPSEIVPIIHSVEEVITSVDPDLIVIDYSFDHAYDAAKKLGKKYVVLSPNTLKEVAAEAQGAGIFKIPCPNTCFPYPVPWHLLPVNIVCYLLMAIWINISPIQRPYNKARNEAGYSGGFPVFSGRGSSILCMSVPELEYPGIIPSHVIPCGPILMPTELLSDADPELAAWVRRGPTVMINLGSHFVQDPMYTAEIVGAIKMLLGKRSDVQVLWKWRKLGDWIVPTIENAGDRLKVVDWLKVDPMSVLRSGLVCSVHHGGSNSYHEALASGTPSVILSPWFDCHDFAMKAEWLGVGIWGNRKHAPSCNAQEFGQALLNVIGDTPRSASAKNIKDRATEVAEAIQAYKNGQEGRDVAADWLWEAAQRGVAERDQDYIPR